MERNSQIVFSALSSEVRRSILALLRDRALTAGEIAEKVHVSKPTLSGHLNVLKQAELVTVERQGTYMLYRINLSVAEDTLINLMKIFKMSHLPSLHRKKGPASS